MNKQAEGGIGWARFGQSLWQHLGALSFTVSFLSRPLEGQVTFLGPNFMCSLITSPEMQGRLVQLLVSNLTPAHE